MHYVIWPRFNLSIANDKYLYTSLIQYYTCYFLVNSYDLLIDSEKLLTLSKLIYFDLLNFLSTITAYVVSE